MLDYYGLRHTPHRMAVGGAETALISVSIHKKIVQCRSWKATYEELKAKY